MIKKKLPIGVQDFRVLREENSLYVDKTELIHQLISEANYYFLSRPRRFGKSLLLSTLKEIFQGSKELFAGLWIENNWDWTKRNPVVHISFAAAGFREMGLTKAIESIIDFQARVHKVPLKSEGVANKFKELLEILNEKHGKVVVLIDEYDKPIVDYIDNVEQANINKEILRDFYVVLKDSPQYLRFVFITGISKFSKVSIFSALNHLKDISMADSMATLVGYTQEELENSFEAYMPSAMQRNDFSRKELLDALRKWYNGYSWDGINRVYNPFSILNFFSEGDFKNFWFSTGTPTFLSVLARKQNFYDLDNVETELTSFETFDIEDLDPQAVMFQTGYLTVKKIDRKRHRYTLSYPNREVRKAFLAYMLEAYTFVPVSRIPPTAIKLENALFSKDILTVIELVNTMFANIPSQIFDGTSEKYFHSLMHLLLNYLGTNIESEINTNKGRIDSVVQTPQYIYVLEFKFNKTADDALKSIHERGYLEKYGHFEQELIAIGINFSSKLKGIDDWKMENL